MSYEVPSDERRDRLLRQSIDQNRHVSRFTPANSVQGDQTGVGSGSHDYSTGPIMSNFALNPEVHNIEGGASDEITLTSSTAIVDHTGAITLKTINGSTFDGQIITIKPLEGKSMTIASGGNIDVTSLVVADDEFVILQFFEDNVTPDTDGSWTIVQTAAGGGGDNLGNHTATTSLKMTDNAIFLDTAQLHSIISLSNDINYTNDTASGGNHKFFVDDLVIPKFVISEDVVASNEPVHIFDVDTNPLLEFNRDYNVGTPTAEDLLAQLSFRGDDSASNELQYANVQVIATNVTNGSEAGRIRFSVAEAGSINLNGFTVSSDTVEHTNQLQSGSADPLEYIFYRNDIGGASANDELGQLTFDGKDSGANRTTFAEIVGISPVVTNGGEVGSIEFKVRDNPGLTTAYTITGDIGSGGQPQHDFEGHGSFEGLNNSASVEARSTHASDPDNALSLSTLSGASNIPEIITPNAQLNINVGGASRLNIDTTTNTDLRLTAFSVPANFMLFDDNSSPLDDDIINTIQFRGRDSGANDQLYAQIIVESSDVTDATEDGTMYLGIVENGVNNATQAIISASTLTHTTQSATNPQGAEFILYRNDLLSDNETVGQVTFDSKDSSGSRVTFAEFEIEASDVTNTTKDSKFKFRVRQNNTLTTIAEINQDGLNLEEISASSTPAANHVVLYGKDDGGVTKLFYKQDNGTEIGPLVDTVVGGGGPPFDDNQVIIQDEIDNTKTLTFNCSLQSTGAANILSWASGASRTHTFSSTTGTVAQLNLAQTWTANQTMAADLLSDVTGRNIGGSGNEFTSIFIDGSLYLGGTTTQRITADAGGMNIDVPTGDTIEFRINGIQAIEIQSNGTLNMSAEDIDNLGDLFFNVSGQEFLSSTSGLRYRVPTGDTHQFEINSVDELTINPTSIDFHSNDLLNTGTILLDGGEVIQSDSATEIGFSVKNTSFTVGTLGTIIIPVTTGVASASDADTKFGNQPGAIGLADPGSSTVTMWFRQTNGNWASVALTRDAAV